VLERRRHAFKERNSTFGPAISISASDGVDVRERLIDAFNCWPRKESAM
jgi:hypothetical protein